MKSPWKTLAVLAVLGLGSGSAAAGGRAAGQDPEARKQERLDRMRQELKLSDEQVQKLQAVFEEAAAQSQADREAAGGDREALHQLARERHRATHEKIEALLTEEQRARSAELRNEHKRRVRERLDSYSR